ncbi:MAG: cyclase family protein [Clostridia bacterium]|nr:cyclase family protein [Clostridia bacterium]
MKIHDISMMIESNMMVYKDKKENRPQLTVVKSLPQDSSAESVISMNVHTGTHIDAASHMNLNGETIEKIELDQLITSCCVLDLTQVENGITKDDLCVHSIESGSFLLFKTKNSYTEAFSPEFIYLTKAGAEYLIEKEIIGVGIDSLGIERNQPEHETHKILMERGIVIIEGLRLKDVLPGNYLLCALPLKIKGADGAPARVVLVETEGSIYDR